MAQNQNVRVALIQMKKDDNNKQRNIDNACELTRQAARNGNAKVVMLPECFNSAYNEKQFKQNAEQIPGGNTSNAMSNLAKECGVFLIAGTIPERDANDTNRTYNTMAVYGPDGRLIAKHRKMHLFDANIQGAINFTESNAFTAGRDFNTFNAHGLRFALGAGNDSAFPEFANLNRQRGCDVLVFANSCHNKVGERTWDLVNRARANDNQFYVAAVSEAQDRNSNHPANGRSMVVDPWGKINKQAGTDQEILYADIDQNEVKRARAQQPLNNQRRTDLYDTVLKQQRND